MSVCVKVRTGKTVSPLSIRSRISTLHPGIMVPDCGEPTLHFYVPGKSIRAVELTKENDGYEVRININSSRYDWRIFRDLISQIISLTDGKAFEEDDDDSPILDAGRAFSDENIEDIVRLDFTSIKALSHNNDVIIFCVNRQICVGKLLFKFAGIDDTTPEDKAAILFEQYLLSIQWGRPGHISTETPLCFTKVKDNQGKEQRISCFIYSDENANRYNYIHYDPFFSIYDADNKEGVVIEYKDLHKIVPSSWTLFDQNQYDCKPLTRSEFNDFLAKAKQFSYYEEESGPIAQESAELEQESIPHKKEKVLHHIYIDTENTRVTVDVSEKSWGIHQGNMCLYIPKHIEFELIYLLYRRKDRMAAASKLLQNSFTGTFVIEDALNQFEKEHPQEKLSRPFTLTDLEPLANMENGLKLMSDNLTFTINAAQEIELIDLLKRRQSLVAWFEEYLKASGYGFNPAVMHKHAVNLSVSYMHYQSLDLDENDLFFGYDKKKVNTRFWVIMVAIIGFCALILLLMSLF